MATFLKELYNNLLEIRTYLIKIGPSRRQGNILQKKLSEARLIAQKYNTFIENISKVERLDTSENDLIDKYCKDFTNLYKEISTLCESTTMEKFNLKVALSLLPVMSDEIHNTRQLIDAIDYYRTIIDNDSQAQLISFVLKSRLSQAAKLKLGTDYKNVSALLTDMRERLLPKKSASALQKQLLNVKQNDLSVDDFGKTLSEMFVDLTLSQSEGDAEKYNILKGINERQAIRQFSEGLRNRRIGTIISAQKFENLKDAIQAAVDEDGLSSNSMAEIMTMRRTNRYYNNNSRQPQYQGQQRNIYGAGRGRGRGAGRRSWPSRGARQWSQQAQPRGGYVPQARSHNRGTVFHNSTRGNRPYRGQIRVLADDQPGPSTSSAVQVESENEFFRV